MKKLFSILFLVGAFALGFSQREYYDDYRRSIVSINWDAVAVELSLSHQQKIELIALNKKYPDYDSWNRKYKGNPGRWTDDRFASISIILGNDKYTKFKKKYYKGQNPVAVYNRNKNNNKPYHNNGNSNHNGGKHKAKKGK